MYDMICYLRVSSWVGIGIGATHVYGKLSHGNRTIDLERKLTHKEATELTEKDFPNKDTRGWLFYKPGTLTTRFDSRAQLIRVAKQVMKKEFPNCTVMLEGDWGNPSRAIVGPDWFVKEANKLYRKADRLGFYNKRSNKHIMDEIYKQWHNLLERLND